MTMAIYRLSANHQAGCNRLRLKCENCRHPMSLAQSQRICAIAMKSCIINFLNNCVSINFATLKEPEEPEPQSKLISQHDSMPPLEHHESYMTSEANEQPPNYDEECLQVYPEEHEFELREKEIDFSKDRSPAAREEIATRCGAEKIFVPNRWGGKTSILNLYVTGILPSPYLRKLHFNEIGLEDVMQVCIR